MGWILVTGAAKGLGREICLALARDNRPIVIHYRTSEIEAKKTAEECRSFGVKAEVLQGDFGSLEGVQTFLALYQSQFTEAAGLVNNVGNFLIAPFGNTSFEEWQSLFQTNVHAPILLIQSLLPSLKKNQGSIVNIGTVGLNTARANSTVVAYSLTKQTLWHLTRSLAKELAADNVRVNMVSPGYLETSVDLKDPTSLPMQRAATLEETARLVAFLFRPENAYLTGQNIEIAGGVGL